MLKQILFNGKITTDSEVNYIQTQRAFAYGDCIFDTLKVRAGHIEFAEDHYLRLVASMRIMRLEIPLNFTPELFYGMVRKVVKSNHLENSIVRVRTTVWRKSSDTIYFSTQSEFDYLIEATEIHIPESRTDDYSIDVFREHTRVKDLLSTIKTNNSLINVLAGRYAKLNHLDNVLLINQDKKIACAVNANVFIINGDQILTPHLDQGCIRGVVRKRLIQFIDLHTHYDIIEGEITPFQLGKSDEVFLTNSIMGLQSVTQFKKYRFGTEKTRKLHRQFLDHTS